MRVKFEEKKSLENDLILMQSQKRTEEIESIINHIEKTRTALQVIYQDKSTVIPCNEFIRFFSADKKVYGKTIRNEYIVRYRLYELEKMLQSNFIRVSNTEIINSRYIKELKLTSSGIVIICFKNGEQTSSSRRYLKRIKECLF